MFGIGFFELLLIAIVALLFVGPRKLPELAKQIGKFYVQARRAATDVRGLVDDVVHQAEREIKDVEHNRIKQLLLSPSKNSDEESSKLSSTSSETREDQRPLNAEPNK